MKTNKEFKFYRISQVLLTSMLSLISLPSYAGGEKGDAANTVYCNGNGNDPRFPQPGYYMLDYAIEESKNHSWHMQNPDPKRNLELIVAKLNKTVPLIMSKDLYSLYYDIDVLLKFPKRIDIDWVATDKNLRISELNESSNNDNSLLDEHLCQIKSIKQIVTYNSRTYYYNIQGYNEVIEAKVVKGTNKDLGPLQKSILWTHELLRGANFSTKEIWKWVRVLHSANFFSLKSTDLISYLYRQNLLTFEESELEDFNNRTISLSPKKRFAEFEKLKSLYRQQSSKVEQRFKLIDLVQKEQQCAMLQEANDYLKENHPSLTFKKMQVLSKNSPEHTESYKYELRISKNLETFRVFFVDYSWHETKNSFEEKYSFCFDK